MRILRLYENYNEYDRYDKEVVNHTLIDKKYIRDTDGFITEYSCYRIKLDDGTIEYECYLGDSDLYNPLNGYGLDFETDSKSEVLEWFDAYTDLDEES